MFVGSDWTTEMGCDDVPNGEMCSEQLIDSATAEQLAQVFRAMADPTRVRILSALVETELWHQLRLLRELRVVRRRREGKHIYYALDDEHVLDLFERGLEHVRHT
jgi:DNA-binding transcriptional ArsR family regulator